MPSSRYDIIPKVLDAVISIKPKSILDVGIGYGKYGVLFREYLDIWQVDSPYDKRNVIIDGVEVFSTYHNPVWRVYDQVYTANILDIIDDLAKTKYDLLFMGDVIEHFNKEDGLRILRDLNYRYAIIVTPLIVSKQEAVYGNPFETHLSEWSATDFPEADVFTINNQQVVVYAKKGKEI